MSLDLFIYWCGYLVIIVGTIACIMSLLLYIYIFVYGTYRKGFPKDSTYRYMKKLMIHDKEEFWEYIEYLKEIENKNDK